MGVTGSQGGQPDSDSGWGWGSARAPSGGEYPLCLDISSSQTCCDNERSAPLVLIYKVTTPCIIDSIGHTA